MKVSPRDYARTNRRWHGQLPISSFDRLPSEISTDSKSVDVYLAFSYDENNQITMKGHASVTAGVACHRCAESVETEIRADIDVRIVGSEELATQLAQVSDVIVVTDNPAPVSELIEDDLIMSIPWRVCNSEKDCPNLNDAGSSERENAPRTESTQKPFANLRELLKP